MSELIKRNKLTFLENKVSRFKREIVQVQASSRTNRCSSSSRVIGTGFTNHVCVFSCIQLESDF